MSARRGRVRPRRAADMEQCVALLKQVHRRDRYPRHWPTRPRDWLCPPSQVGAWVAEDEQQLLGHVALARPDQAAAVVVWSAALELDAEQLLCVSLLFVSPDARGRGVGTRLLGEAESFARARRAHPVLEVVSLDRDVVNFYVRQGWRPVGAWVPDWLPVGAQSLLFTAP